MFFIIAAYAVSAAVLYAAGMRRCGKDPVFSAPGRFVFTFLSLTWGLPMTVAGAVAALFLLVTGHRPKRFGYCVLFELKKLGFGLSLGLFIIAPQNDLRAAAHEHGHSVQNIYFGPFMPLSVGVPSLIRYHFRRIKMKITKRPCRRVYDGVWFERSATESGLDMQKNVRR